MNFSGLPGAPLFMCNILTYKQLTVGRDHPGDVRRAVVSKVWRARILIGTISNHAS